MEQGELEERQRTLQTRKIHLGQTEEILVSEQPRGFLRVRVMVPQPQMGGQEAQADGDFSLEVLAEMAGGKRLHRRGYLQLHRKSLRVAAAGVAHAQRRVNFTQGEMDFQA